MFTISDKVINYITREMENWKVELTAGRQTHVEAKIKRSIFSRRLILATCYSNDDTESHIEEMHRRLKYILIHKISGKDKRLAYMDDVKIFCYGDILISRYFEIFCVKGGYQNICQKRIRFWFDFMVYQPLGVI